MKFFIIFFTLVVINNADLVPIGGANCTDDIECGGINAGRCNKNNTCECPDNLADVDCSYVRHNAYLAGGLNIGLPFVGIGGIGNFIIGRTGHAVGQLILLLSFWFLMIPFCIMGCVFRDLKKFVAIIGGVFFCTAWLAATAGFIWSITEGALMIEGNIVDGNGFDLYRS